jgi:hypothetical protein
VLIISCAQYLHGVNNLPGSANDGDAYEKWLAISSEVIRLKDPGRAAVISTINAFCPTLVIYCGHGMQRRVNGQYHEYFYFSDGSTLSDEEVMRLSRKGVSVIADSCHSGGMLDGGTTAPRGDLRKETWDDVSRSLGDTGSIKRTFIVAATAKDRPSYEGLREGRIRGYFSFELTNALRSKDMLRNGRLANFLHRRVGTPVLISDEGAFRTWLLKTLPA